MKKLMVCAAMSLLAGAAAGAGLTMQEKDGVGWICGGVGADERREMRRLESQASVVLLFVTVKRGGYLADAEVSLYDAGAKSPRFQTTADGPICVFRLPAGRYRIDARLGDAKRTASITVAEGAKQPLRAVLTFPAEPWDGIWAEAEEKRQAKEP